MPQEKILFLGSKDSPLITWLQEQGEQVIQKSDKITPEYIKKHTFTFLISYGYNYIINKEILALFPNKAINLHISYLPYNRGADPNFWSFIENTPKGVTIHYIDEGIDTGDIIMQKKVAFDINKETLATSYQKLQNSIQCLFKNNWENIKNGKCIKKKQEDKGSQHTVKDKLPLSYLLTDGWNTPVSTLHKYALENSRINYPPN